MKLEPRSYQIFWDVHAWVGVVSALLLYVMFLLGAFALFRGELDAWAEPTREATPSAEQPRLQPLLAGLSRQRTLFGADRVAFAWDKGGLRAYVSRGRDQQTYRYSPREHRLEPSQTELGSFLYSLHYLGPIPNGIYVAGLAALALLLALVSGLLIQLKDLVRQGLQFRPARSARTWTSDLHKVLGVFGLPYQLFFAWSGAMLCVAGVAVEPALRAGAFHGDARALAAARGEPAEVDAMPTGTLQNELPDVDALLLRARQEIPGLSQTWLGIEHFGDTASIARIYGTEPSRAFGNGNVVLRTRDASLLGVSRAQTAGAFPRFEAWFYGLHFAELGGYGVRLMYALLALATSAVLLTGNLIWLARRESRKPGLGNRVLAALTVGFCVGVLVAIGMLFLASRTLPSDLAHRPIVEQTVFWLSWLASAVYGCFGGRRRAVVRMLRLAGGFCLSAVVVDIFRGASLPVGLYGAVDLAVASFAFSCAFAAVRLSKRALGGRLSTASTPSRAAV